MAQVIRGTRESKHGKLVRQTATGGSRKIRCPGCYGLAIPAQRPDGTAILRCQGSCAREFTVRKL